MNLHEYQAKRILSGYGVSVPVGEAAKTAAAAERVARQLPGKRYVVKAQVHAGGRGRAGGIKIVDSVTAVGKAAEELLGQTLVTEQTGPEGRIVKAVYVEEAVGSERDVYVAVLVDRQAGKVALIGSEKGGEDIEERAAVKPEIVKTLLVNPDGSAEAEAFEDFATQLDLTGKLANKAVSLFQGLTKPLSSRMQASLKSTRWL